MESNNSDIYFMIVAATIVLVILLCFIVSFLFIYKSRQAHHQLEMKRAEEHYQEEILKTQLEIKEQTLKNISEEIHDNVGQILSLAILHLSAIELHNTESAALKIENITRLVEKAVHDLRSLSKTMDPGVVADNGLLPIIRFELELLEKTSLYKTSFRLSGNEQRLSPSKEIIIYRMVQESINNVIKHARATAVDVMMAFSGKEVVIEICDNGTGFNPAAIKQDNITRNGAGIKNMMNRAKLIGARLDINSVTSAGTKVIITVPVVSEDVHH